MFLGGLANAIQSELKRRAEGKPLPIKSIVKNSPTTTHLAGNSNNPNTTTKKPPNTITTLIHPDQHNQLMAEFRQVHKKMFTLSGITEDSEVDLLVSDTWLDTGIGYWYRYPMTRYYERLLDTRSS